MVERRLTDKSHKKKSTDPEDKRPAKKLRNARRSRIDELEHQELFETEYYGYIDMDDNILQD